MRPSLRLRLTLLWSVVSLIVLLGLELVALAVLSAQLTGELDRDLALEARQYQQNVAGARNLADLQQRATGFLATDSDAGTGFTSAYVIRFVDGTLVTNTQDLSLRATISAARRSPGQPVTVHDASRGDLRVAVIPIAQNGRQVGDLRIALPLSGAESTVRNLLTPMLVANALLIGLGGLLAYVVIGGGLAPVRAITATAASISDGELSRRIGYRGPRDGGDAGRDVRCHAGSVAKRVRAAAGLLFAGLA
jgi:two-component system, OmpR family, sensor kinase